MNLTISSKPFDLLTPKEVHDTLQLRSEVFVVEQKCIFLDIDGKDPFCEHLMIYSDRLVGASRLVPPGLSYEEMSIGRVVTHKGVRGTGVGKILMAESIRALHACFGEGPVKIGAQYYLKKFYESFGFSQCSEVYDEDGIDHILMLKRG